MTRAPVTSNTPAHPLPTQSLATAVLAAVASSLLVLACSSTTSGGGDSPPPGGPAASSTSPTEAPAPPKTGEEDGGERACETSADCTDPRYEVCDPSTRTCKDAECGVNAKTQNCAAGKICV